MGGKAAEEKSVTRVSVSSPKQRKREQLFPKHHELRRHNRNHSHGQSASRKPKDDQKEAREGALQPVGQIALANGQHCTNGPRLFVRPKLRTSLAISSLSLSLSLRRHASFLCAMELSLAANLGPARSLAAICTRGRVSCQDLPRLAKTLNRLRQELARWKNGGPGAGEKPVGQMRADWKKRKQSR